MYIVGDEMRRSRGVRRRAACALRPAREAAAAAGPSP